MLRKLNLSGNLLVWFLWGGFTHSQMKSTVLYNEIQIVKEQDQGKVALRSLVV